MTPSERMITLRAMDRLRMWWSGESGASLIEYALLVALIAIVAIAAVNLAGNEVSSTFRNVASELR